MNLATLNIDNGGALVAAAGSQATFTGAVLVNGTMTISGTSHVTTGTSFIHDAGSVATFNNAPTFNLGGTVTNGAAWSFNFAGGTAMQFNGGSSLTLSGTTALTATTGTFITVNPGATFTLVSGATATIQTPLTLNGPTGTIRWRPVTIVTGATTLVLAAQDTIEATMGSTYTVTLTGTPVDGQRIRFTIGPTYPIPAGVVTFSGAALGAQFFQLQGSGGPPGYVCVEITYDASTSTWRKSQFSFSPP